MIRGKLGVSALRPRNIRYMKESSTNRGTFSRPFDASTYSKPRTSSKKYTRSLWCSHRSPRFGKENHPSWFLLVDSPPRRIEPRQDMRTMPEECPHHPSTTTALDVHPKPLTLLSMGNRHSRTFPRGTRTREMAIGTRRLLPKMDRGRAPRNFHG